MGIYEKRTQRDYSMSFKLPVVQKVEQKESVWVQYLQSMECPEESSF